MVAESVQDSTGMHKESKNACESNSDTAADYQKHGSSQALGDVREPELHTKARKRSFGDVEATTSPISSQPVTSSTQEKSGSTHALSNHPINGASGDAGARKRLRTSEVLPNETKDSVSDAARSSSTDLSASDGIMECEATSSATTPSEPDALKSSDPQPGRHKDSPEQSASFSPPKPLIDDQFHSEIEKQLSHYSSLYPISPGKGADGPSKSAGPSQNLSVSNRRRARSPIEHQSNLHQYQPPHEARPHPFYLKSGHSASLPNHLLPKHQSTSDVQSMPLPSSSDNSITTLDDSVRLSKFIHDGADAIMELFTEQLKSVQTFHKQQMVKFTTVYEVNQRAVLENELTKKEQEVQERLNKGFADTLAAKEKEAKESLRRVQKKAYEDYQKQLEVSETNFQKLYQDKLNYMAEEYVKDLRARQGKLVEAEKREQTTQTTNQNLSQKLGLSEAKFVEAVKIHQAEISRLKSENEERLKIMETELTETRRKEASALSECRALERRLKINDEKLEEVIKNYAEHAQEVKEVAERIRQDRDSTLESLRRDFDDERHRLEACIAEERRKFIKNAELQEKVEKLEEQVAAKQEQESMAETRAKKAGIVIMKYLEDARVKEDLISECSSLLSAKVELDTLRETLVNERKLLEEEKHVLFERIAKFEQEKVLFEEVKKSATHWVKDVKPSLEMQHAAERDAWEKERASWEQTLKDTIARERKAAELSGYEKAISEARDRTQKLTDSENKIAAQNVAIEKEKASLTKLSQKLDKRQKQLDSTYAAKISEVENMHAQTVQRMQVDDNLRVVQLNDHWTKEMERRWVTFMEGDKKEKEKEQAEREAEREIHDLELQSYRQRLEESEKRLQALEKQHREDHAHAQTQAKTIEDLMDGRKLAALGTYSRAEAKDVLEKLVLPGPNLLNGPAEVDGQSSASDPCHLQ